MKANRFILSECTMRPIREFGVDTSILRVISPAGNHIGGYDPNHYEFLPHSNWKNTFSNELIERCGLNR